MKTMERDVFAAISEARRREILEHMIGLTERGTASSVTDIARELGMDRSTVSRCLAFLRECSVVTCRRLGTQRLHSLVVEPLRYLDDWANALGARLDELAHE